MLCDLKEGIGSNDSGVQTMCPTGQTVRAESFASIIANYNNIQLLWETEAHATSDTEMEGGHAAAMPTVKTLEGSQILSEYRQD